MVQYEPTHSVKHKIGWQANLYIAPSLQTQLRSWNTSERERAEQSVCIKFLRACEKKFPSEFNLSFVEFGHLSLTTLPPMMDPTVYPRMSPPAAASAPKTKPADAPHCCDNDNCVPCDIGYHSSQCREGCTIP